MKILFTGGSSFTGCWFIRELGRAGHEITATFQRQPAEYPDALRRQRVSMALAHSRGMFECSFGDATFLDLLRNEPWDVLCHHAADVTNYKSEDFDVAGALRNNTHNIGAVLAAFKSGGAKTPGIVLTGSVFENDEGAGSQGLPAFSPYGLSKSLTYQVFRYHVQRAGLPLGKFVIPNPFGPLEEPRFTAYLMKTWFAGKVAAVNTPAYVRDNIHISLLAQAYAEFAATVGRNPGLQKLNPSGYVESQGAFALRFATEMRARTGLPCEVDLKQQTEFPEPRSRINTDILDAGAFDWDESIAWAEIADYYKAIHKA